jgi:hypothetical protein
MCLAGRPRSQATPPQHFTASPLHWGAKQWSKLQERGGGSPTMLSGVLSGISPPERGAGAGSAVLLRLAFAHAQEGDLRPAACGVERDDARGVSVVVHEGDIMISHAEPVSF